MCRRGNVRKWCANEHSHSECNCSRLGQSDSGVRGIVCCKSLLKCGFWWPSSRLMAVKVSTLWPSFVGRSCPKIPFLVACSSFGPEAGPRSAPSSMTGMGFGSLRSDCLKELFAGGLIAQIQAVAWKRIRSRFYSPGEIRRREERRSGARLGGHHWRKQSRSKIKGVWVLPPYDQF